MIVKGIMIVTRLKEKNIKKRCRDRRLAKRREIRYRDDSIKQFCTQLRPT